MQLLENIAVSGLLLLEKKNHLILNKVMLETRNPIYYLDNTKEDFKNKFIRIILVKNQFQHLLKVDRKSL